MLSEFDNARRSNRGIFTYPNTGSPMHDLMIHISGRNLQDRDGNLGLNRLDFERCMVKGDVLYAIEGDSIPVSQQDEEARIGTLAYAIKRLGNAEDAVEFLLCLETICGEDSDSLGRQKVASFYYREIAGRGVRVVLKEMALLSMQLAGLNPVVEVAETDIEDDIMLIGLRNEDAEIATLAFARKRFGNEDDAIAFILCLDAICGKDCGERDRIKTAAFYYNEIDNCGAIDVLKGMVTLSMRLTDARPVVKAAETVNSNTTSASRHSSGAKGRQSPFKQELKSVKRMLRGRRRACVVYDYSTEWLNELESSGATIEELDDAFTRAEAMAQYDERGAGIAMSSHERTVACGRIDPEFTADDLPEQARHLAGYMRRAYVEGLKINEIWDEVDAELRIIFPVSIEFDLPKSYFPSNLTIGRIDLVSVERHPRFTSRANIELQSFTREILEAMLDECSQDIHLTAMRCNRIYRYFHAVIRKATDTKVIGKIMQAAYAAKEAGRLSLKYFTLLKTASDLQRGRLMDANLSPEAYRLMKKVKNASPGELRYLARAFYGDNEPDHPIHSLPSQEQARLWDELKGRQQLFAEKGTAFVMARYLVTKSESLRRLLVLLIASALYHRASRLPKNFAPPTSNSK